MLAVLYHDGIVFYGLTFIVLTATAVVGSCSFNLVSQAHITAGMAQTRS